MANEQTIIEVSDDTPAQLEPTIEPAVIPQPIPTPEPEPQQSAPSQDNGMVPRERLNEVIAKARMAEQLAQQREAYARQKELEAQQAQAQLAAWQQYNGQAQQVQQAPQDPVTTKFLGLLKQGVETAVEGRFKALENKLQRFDAVAEHTEQQQFWAQNAHLTQELRDLAEGVYQQNKQVMPNLTRQAALIYAKGLVYEQQQQAALQQAQASQAAMTKVNAQARAVTTPPAPARAPKKFEDMSSAEQDAWLRSEAEKGRFGGG